MKTQQNTIVRRFPAMLEAGPVIAALRAKGLYVTVKNMGEGLSGTAYEKATKDFAFEVTAREFVVGDGATISRYSDSNAFTVISRTAKTLTLQRDRATLLNPSGSKESDALKFSPGGFFGHTSGAQRWQYEANPEGEIEVARLTKRGWEVKGQRVSGGRSEHYDFNF